MNICDYATNGLNELKVYEIIGGTGSEFVWKYHITDTIPPETTCTLAGEMESGIYVSNMIVILTAIDNGSGMNYTKYTPDASTWMTYTEPFIVTDDGNYILLFYSADINGNTEQQKTWVFTIQKHPMINIKIKGDKGVSIVIENKRLLPLNEVPWCINLSGGIILKGKLKTGLIPQLIHGEEKTLTSSVFGFGKITIKVPVGGVEKTEKRFVILFFVVKIK